MMFTATTETVPWFGARKMARALMEERRQAHAEITQLRAQLERLGALTVAELEAKKTRLQQEIDEQSRRLDQERAEAAAALQAVLAQLEQTKCQIVETEDLALLQEVGIYRYRHPLSDAVAYEQALARLETRIKDMARKDGGAIISATNWTVNNSVVQGRKMVSEMSKLMLRAFNAEADNLVRV